MFIFPVQTRSNEAEAATRWRKRVIRPPWSREDSVRSLCTSCGDCIAACPEAILVAGPAGTPVVDFYRGECTFCGDCARSCEEGVFADLQSPPWNKVAAIDESCLLNSGVACRACTDHCDRGALKFEMQLRGAGTVHVLTDECTACGACVAGCPADAIKIIPIKEKEVAQ